MLHHALFVVRKFHHYNSTGIVKNFRMWYLHSVSEYNGPRYRLIDDRIGTLNGAINIKRGLKKAGRWRGDTRCVGANMLKSFLNCRRDVLADTLSYCIWSDKVDRKPHLLEPLASVM